MIRWPGAAVAEERGWYRREPVDANRVATDALGPRVDELPPLPDEVIYRIAAILHQHREEESGSKG